MDWLMRLFDFRWNEPEEEYFPDIADRESSNDRIRVIDVQSADVAKEVIDLIKKDIIVLLNFSSVDHAAAQLVMNYIAGAVYALEATTNSISDEIVLVMPKEI